MKKSFFILLAILFLFSVSINATSEIKTMTGIKDHEYKIKPYGVEQSTGEVIYMIPLRETCDALGFDVDWHGKGKITVKKGMFQASLEVGKDNYKNRYGKDINLYLTPTIEDGVTYVPHIFFYYVLDMDVFYLNDSLYFRYRIENIMPKVYSKYVNEITTVNQKDKDGNVKRVDKKATLVKTTYIVYPYIENKSHSFVNKELDKYMKNLIDSYDYDGLYIKYDIGMYDKNFLSVIYDGYIVKDGKRRKVFNSINFDLKGKKVLTPGDFINNSWSDRQKIVDMLRESYKSGQFMFGDLNMYLMNGAVIFFVPEANPTPMEYYKNYQIEDMVRPEYRNKF